jgi:hypothetical protein
MFSMKFSNLFSKEAWENSFHGFGMKVSAAKPEIFLISGGLSMLAGTIYACIKTADAKIALENAKKKEAEADFQEKIETVDDKTGEVVMVERSEDELKQLRTEKGKKLTKIYIHTAYEMLKIYGIPAILWFGGMGMICSGHHILRQTNAGLVADSILAKKLFDDYRARVAKAVGEEAEQKIFMGTQEEMIHILETDPETGKETLVEKQGDVFYANPGSIFAVNFAPETSDAFDTFTYAEQTFDRRVEEINTKLEMGIYRAFNGIEIFRMLGFNENALGFGDGVAVEERLNKLLSYGISGNARKVPDPEMRKLKVTKLKGYQRRFDVARNMDIYVPCTRYDFNFYPLEGKI